MSCRVRSDGRNERREGEHARGALTLPQQAGQVFAEIQPRLAVYSHIVRLSNAEVAAPPMSDLIDKTRQSYDGPLLVGQDLTSIVIGPDQVRVEQPKLGLRPVAP